MQTTNQAYREAITGATRYITPDVIADFTDPDVIYGAVTSSGVFPYTDPDQLTAKETELDGHFFTLEPHRFLFDGNGQLYAGAPPDVHQGFTINKLSNDKAIFTTPQYAQRDFSNYRVMQALSLFFSKNPIDGIGVDFKLEIFSGAAAVYTKEVTGNIEDEVYFTGFTVYQPTAVRVTFSRWSLPNRRARIASVILGVYEIWRGKDLAGIDILQQADPSNLTVSYDIVTVKVWNKGKRFNRFNAAGIFASICERQRMDFGNSIRLEDGSMKRFPAGSYYIQNEGWESNAYEQVMTFRLVNIVGLLATRTFITPNPAPTTLAGWAAACVAHLGVNFLDRYQVDPSIANTPVIGAPKDISCGDVLRYACMLVGAFFRADAVTGDLLITPLPPGGLSGDSIITLDNQYYYPVNKARLDIASLTIERSNGQRATYIGTDPASEKSVNIRNPFILTAQEAEAAARHIFIHYGGTEFEVQGRGDLAAELGDIERLETGFDNTVAARRYKQQYIYEGGIMRSRDGLYLATGIELYETVNILEGAGTFTVPAGINSLRLIIVQGGDGGGHGGDGAWSRPGTPGGGGLGGRIYTVTINVNPGATFSYSVGKGGAAGGSQGQQSTFGSYSSASGIRADSGYADIYSGGVFSIRGHDGQTGTSPGRPGDPGSGQGGGGGDGGWQGARHYDPEVGYTVTDRAPGKGQKGGAGGSGAIIVYHKAVQP